MYLIRQRLYYGLRQNATAARAVVTRFLNFSAEERLLLYTQPPGAVRAELYHF